MKNAGKTADPRPRAVHLDKQQASFVARRYITRAQRQGGGNLEPSDALKTIGGTLPGRS